MHPLIRILFRGALLFLLLFALIQPFNWFCNISQKCQPFYFSYYFPKTQGTEPIDVSFEITNYRDDLEFSALEPNLTTVTNKKNIVTFYAKNLSNRLIKFRPNLQIDPANFDEYVIRYECLCMREYKLKKGESLELKMRFEIDAAIENEEKFIVDNSAKSKTDRTIKIKYRIK